ncbi:MAG: ABC transporter ATP-binding protein [Lachnospiraceae bacterium]|nr:ABC transporter ATP-binding protein [Lachnospiraceae bacterium]
MIYDCDRASGIYGSRFRRIIMPFCMTCCYLGMMFWLNVEVTACLLGVSMIMFVIHGAFVKPLQRVGGRLSAANAVITEQITDLLAGMEQIKMFSLGRIMVDRFIEGNEAYYRQQQRRNLLSAELDGLTQFFELMGSLVFIALGLFWVDRGVTTVDRLAAIYLLYGSMSWNFLQVGVYIPSMAEYLVNAKNVFTFLELEEEPECCHEIAERKGRNQCGNRNKEVVLGTKQNMSDNKTLGHAVSMQKVTFAYEGREALFSDYDLAIPSGKYVVIKGESGKGKSTIMKLLLGLYPAITGEITVHDMDLRKTPLRKIREHIAYVPQEAYLYDVSIEENIRWGNPHADREAVIRAAKLAHAHEFIMQLENEYETRVGERGSHLSGGQRQRIAIARALVKDADILILDEATSALDQGTEQLVTEEIKRQREGRTTIAITHRENAWQMADAVIEL